MILVTTGTNGAAFDRLLRAVDRLGGDERVVVQHGPSTLRPRNSDCFDYVSFPELVELVQQARVVITHAGVGSILVALMNEKKPIVVPRLPGFHEIVDNHQRDLARKLSSAGLVTLVEDVERIAEAVDGASRTNGSNGRRTTALADDLGRYLDDLISAR